MLTGNAIRATYDPRLVALSILIAIFASYAALDLAGRVTAARNHARFWWLIGGATAMGTGIWSMHYTGMLAYRLPLPVYYHVPTVLLSLLAAIFASLIALFVVSRLRITTLHVILGSILMGAGIATMHYTGMAAMRLAAMHHYDPGLWSLSVLLAILISLVALWLTSHFREEKRGRLLKIGTAVVMGLAIPIMHYTGMAAVSYMPTNERPDLVNALDISVLANRAIILVTLVLLGAVLLTSLVDRRFSAQARALALSEHRYQLLFEANPQPTLVFDLNTLFFVAVNRAAVNAYGFSAKGFLEQKITAVHAGDKVGGLLDAVTSSLPIQAEHRRKDGTAFEVELSLRTITWLGEPAALLIANDITERKRTERLEVDRRHFLETVSQNEPLEDSLAQLVRVLETQFPSAVCSVVLLKLNKLTQVTANAFSKDLGALLERFGLEEVAQIVGVRAALREVGVIANLPQACQKLGLVEWANALHVKSCWISAVTETDSSLSGLILVFFRDVRRPTLEDSSRLQMAAGMASIAVVHRRLTDRLSYQAQHDALTGLPNRFLLEDRLQQAIAYANRHGSGLAVLFLDLDGFKYINDSLGHPAGDQVLIEVSRRLQSFLRQTDTLARIGGDEFCLVLSDLGKPADAFHVAQGCLDLLRKPISIAGRDYLVSASIGISNYPEHGMEAETLQQNADTAMYHAKATGKNGFQLFSPEVNTHLRERLELMGDLQRALDKGDFQLEYQPLFVDDGELIGLEALLRWNHPERGRIAPDKFISIAEETGLVIPIGKWVLNQACQQLANWHRSGYTSLRMSVNVSTVEFEHHDWLKTVSDALAKNGLPPACLELELTESVVLKNSERAVERFSQLRSMGVTSAIDDFGTGYSSLKYLQNLPIDTLKIDQSFVRDLHSPSDNKSGTCAIVRTIVTLAQHLGLRVVAEGVETEEELAVLRSLGCNLVQGYLFARPMLAEACDLFLRDSYAPSARRGGQQALVGSVPQLGQQ